jgi:hypothetical protein
MAKLPVALEVGTKRVFAIACDWPGWARTAKDEEGALQALLDAAPRYAAAIQRVRTFAVPRSVERFEVVERLSGDATTDFGAPGAIGRFDEEPANPRDLARLEAILRACWTAFEDRVADANGVTLAKGPRGGGRSLAKIQEHVAGAAEAYLRALGGTVPKGGDGDALRDAFVEAMGQRARGELPDVGPRGGARWPARFAARREAWHVLDHTWEIEDRTAHT